MHGVEMKTKSQWNQNISLKKQQQPLYKKIVILK